MSEAAPRAEELSETTLRPEDLEVEWVSPAAPNFLVVDQDPIQGGDPASGRIYHIGNRYY